MVQDLGHTGPRNFPKVGSKWSPEVLLGPFGIRSRRFQSLMDDVSSTRGVYANHLSSIWIQGFPKTSGMGQVIACQLNIDIDNIRIKIKD